MSEAENLLFIAIGKKIEGVPHIAGIVCSGHMPSDKILVITRGEETNTEPLPLGAFYDPEIRELTDRLAYIPARTPHSDGEHRELLARYPQFFGVVP